MSAAVAPPTSTPKASRSPRTIRIVGLVAVVVLLGGGLFWLRGLPGPLVKADWTSGSSGPGVVDELQAASYVVAMPGGAPATITAVHATTDNDLEVIGTYVWTRGRANVSAAATSWPLDRLDREAPGPAAMARPGAFRMSTRRASPFSDTVVTVVLNPRRPGLLRVKTLEVEYRRGLRRRHKTWTDVGPGICANARGTSDPTNGPCDERED